MFRYAWLGHEFRNVAPFWLENIRSIHCDAHHQCGYAHTDLKSDNVLVKLGDVPSTVIDDYLQAN